MAFYYADGVPKHIIGDALRFKTDSDQPDFPMRSNSLRMEKIIVRARMEHDGMDQCVLHFSVQDSGIGLSGTDRKKAV